MTSGSSHTQYRQEIDGLRALAVLPVLFFHFSLPGFQGGFVGVDIFFVISGFLIGGLLWAELTNTGKIRLGNFFLRRIKRLAPAYFTMAIVSFIFAWFILLPFDFREFGKELIASTVYLSNIHFYRVAGYFDTAAEQKVLLHTWSLSVEEQFYIFLPFALILLSRLRRFLFPSLIIVAVVSLVACVLVTPILQTATFYLFPFRAWELLAGVCLAIFGQMRGFQWALHASLSWAGLIIICGAIILIPSDTGFPGYLAILPVLGAFLILANGHDKNAVNRVLHNGVLQFFGQISYSLYLWHWPVIVLATYYLGDDITFAQRLLLIGGAVILAWASWRFVETPIRRRDFAPLKILSATAMASCLTLGLGALLFIKDGLVERFPPQIRTHIDASADFLQDWQSCNEPTEGAFAGIRLCPIGPQGEPKVLIWGDSHIRALKEGLEQAAYEANVPAVIIWRAGCPPVFGIDKDENGLTRLNDMACTNANLLIEKAIENTSIETLLLVGRWSYYAEGRGVGIDAHNTIMISPSAGSTLEPADQATLLENAFKVTTERLSHHFSSIFILQQVPAIPEYTSFKIARDLAHGHLTDPDQIDSILNVSRAEIEIRSRQGQAAIEGAARHPSVTILDSWDAFCTQDSCSAIVDGQASYFDNNHITNTMARRMRHIFAPVFLAADRK